MHQNRQRPKSMRRINTCSIVAATILAIATLIVLQLSLEAQSIEGRVSAEYQSCETAAEQLQESSDYLTTEARQYVISADASHLDNYLNELTQSDRRDSAIHVLRDHSTSEDAIESLGKARAHSDELAEVELYALRLFADAQGVTDLPEALASIEIDEQDASLSAEDKTFKAYDLLNDTDYTTKKLQITDEIQACSDVLVRTLRTELEETNAGLVTMLTLMRLGVILLVGILAIVIASTSLLLLKPMARYATNISNDEPLEPDGAQELRLLTLAYNDMYEKTTARTKSLDHEAHNDALTGLLNRGSFDTLLTQHKGNSALILIDVDNFKQFNDEHGHEMGDAILVEVAATLYSSFRSTDFVFRIGGDEFAVIMTNAQPDLTDVIARSIDKVASFLRDEGNGLPAATISVGVAFGSPGCADDELFAAADGALYEVKRKGRDGIAFAEEQD